MKSALKGMRRHIAILGRCNTGKSTLLNRIAGQQAALVADTPGTTADPVPLSFELLPLGPVTLYDTAGLDEAGALGAGRRKAALAVLERVDMAVLVTDGTGIAAQEEELIATCRKLKTPFILFFNRQGETAAPRKDFDRCREEGIPFLALDDGREAEGDILRRALLELAPEMEKERELLLDLVPEKGMTILITPVDSSAPKGRLIAPQVQSLRELLDGHRMSLVVQTEELGDALAALRREPALVVTDSQAVKAVAAITPDSVPLTTFSLLFSRLKGDFALQAAGAAAIRTLQPGARILVAESCSHHPQGDDIGRVKLPALLRTMLGFELSFSVCAGRDFPADLCAYSLVLHCGGCMLSRREMQRRLRLCADAGVPVTNYGMAISAAQGVLERVVAPLLRAERNRA
ncbi:[FeFe] hydrogenase H-cluster maturation GTPase HydF [Desulfovibrio sp. OttesenSCG-928-I05]|nr:[FeFe] hydrogenase H-cluster maturation GTPase HydF [Desulfovibrio sp. OttesenSCG-928-I05]